MEQSGRTRGPRQFRCLAYLLTQHIKLSTAPSLVYLGIYTTVRWSRPAYLTKRIRLQRGGLVYTEYPFTILLCSTFKVDRSIYFICTTVPRSKRYNEFEEGARTDCELASQGGKCREMTPLRQLVNLVFTTLLELTSCRCPRQRAARQ